jgi:long-chain fatty acid transport protein
MKKTIKLALVASLALGATSAFATNGTSLIGFGAKSRGMGGTGIAQFQGAESGFNNPALIGYAKTNEASIGGTYFAPDVSIDIKNLFGPGSESKSSSASASMIPAISTIDKVNDNFAWGLALYGVGGMGVDYRSKADGNDMPNDNLLLMRVALPLSYTTSGFSIGLSPVVEYGALSMNNFFGSLGGATSDQAPNGVTTDIAYGFELGAAYQIAGVTLGLDYKSAVTHNFENTFNSSMTPGETQSKLDTPQVIGAGISYEIAGNTIAFDYKNIAYSSAKGFEDFGWDDVNTFALGYEYAAETWAVRLGYNYGAQPLPTDLDTSSAQTMNTTFAQSFGSLAAFPAVTESHYTIGGTYVFSKMVSLDAAFVYGTGNAKADYSAFAGPGTPSDTITVEATNDQTSLTVAVNYNF